MPRKGKIGAGLGRRPSALLADGLGTPFGLEVVFSGVVESFQIVQTVVALGKVSKEKKPGTSYTYPRVVIDLGRRGEVLTVQARQETNGEGRVRFVGIGFNEEKKQIAICEGFIYNIEEELELILLLAA